MIGGDSQTHTLKANQGFLGHVVKLLFIFFYVLFI